MTIWHLLFSQAKIYNSGHGELPEEKGSSYLTLKASERILQKLPKIEKKTCKSRALEFAFFVMDK